MNLKMKAKVFLIGFIIFYIFQLITMAAAISIGSPAINRDDAKGAGTRIELLGAADGTGTITEVVIFAYSEMADCEVATFYLEAGTNYSTRRFGVRVCYRSNFLPASAK